MPDRKHRTIYRGTSGERAAPSPLDNVRVWPRCSSTGRNWQDIPRQEMPNPNKPRKVFSAAEVPFINADYTQMELRVAALCDYSEDLELELRIALQKILRKTPP